jgi:hypothetical protein
MAELIVHLKFLQALAERARLQEECELLSELLMLKHYKNLTDNRLNMSSARRRSLPQKKVLKAADPASLDDSKMVQAEDSEIRLDSVEVDHTAVEENCKDVSVELPL